MRSKNSSRPKRPAGSLRARLWTLLACALSGACAPQFGAHYGQVRVQMAQHRDDEALKYLDGHKQSIYGAQSELLYLMDRAMLQFDGHDDVACVATLEQTKQLGDKLAAGTGHDDLSGWLQGDGARSYRGEDFERVFVHLLEALSYARRGQYSDARVEARQVTTRLAALSDRLKGASCRYQDDAFAHFLAGMLYEADRHDLSHLSDARIEYAHALALYERDGPHFAVPVPKALITAYARVLGGLGPEGAAQRTALLRRYPAAATPPKAEAQARIVVVALVGEAPHKMEAFWELVVLPNVYRVAYPMFARHARARPPTVWLNHQRVATPAHLVTDLQNVAIANLGDHMASIKNRIVARDVMKYAMGTAAEVVGLERGGWVGLGTYMAGLALNSVTAASTRADLRSWMTLPDALYLYAIDVVPGPITVQVGRELLPAATIQPGETLFFATRSLD